ncbi:DUF1385 domain-containing protein [archaeon]|jgi:uncharacterized protein YqhQ|nr:DUF1385 domain-containing protein [archaeon]MBT3451397.1 DUF1385 domain-containing protein [archaeon]MBT6869006.1 DUF1385 domain-containing protein [archaeon]MBT7193272.1 DUF1385 domain-containing protein [archaeon]MBT7380127.1 DUF1385 domain-containing protein [archaeon]
MKVGGQAVIEGVMMRNKEKFAVAVRLENGNIKLMKNKSSKFPKYFNFPLIRGVIGLFFMLYDGIKALIWSSNQQLYEDEQISTKEIIFTLLISFAFSIIIFIIVPFFIASAIHSEGLIFDLLDGVFRLSLFLIYLAAISYMEDINVLFQYHGAEHKTINCYESKEKLTVANAQRYSRFSPRCGTSFLFIVFMVSILLFTFLPEQFWLKLLGRIVLIPFVAGISYEIVKLSDRYSNNVFVKIIIAPGLWLQRLTTREPSDRQVKVAIESLDGVLRQ